MQEYRDALAVLLNATGADKKSALAAFLLALDDAKSEWQMRKVARQRLLYLLETAVSCTDWPSLSFVQQELLASLASTVFDLVNPSGDDIKKWVSALRRSGLPAADLKGIQKCPSRTSRSTQKPPEETSEKATDPTTSPPATPPANCAPGSLW